MREHYSYKDYSSIEYASSYDQTRFGDIIGQWIHELEIGLLEEELDFKGKSVIDVGVGTGRISIFLAEKGAQVTGLDASQAMLNILQKKIVEGNLHVDLKLGDALNIPFLDRRFDYVVSFMTIMHVVNWKRMLSEMCRVSDNYIILQFPSKVSYACMSPLIQPVRRIFNKKFQTWHSFFVREIVKVIQENEFQILWRKKELVLPTMTHRIFNSLNFSKKVEVSLSKMKITSLIGNPVLLVAVRK